MAIIRAPNQGFDVLIQTLLNKERLSQEKERINLQKKDLENRIAERQAREERLKDIELGARLASQFAAQSGFMPGIGEAASAVPQESLPSFMENIIGFLQGGAQARTATSTANVAEGTEDARITTATTEAEVTAATAAPRIRAAQAGATQAESDARVATATEDARIEGARASLSDTQIRNALNSQVLRGSDPANGARAFSVWSEGQVTWDEAKEIVGFTGETSIPGDAKFQAPGAGGSADRAKASSFLPLLSTSHQRIQQLGSGDVDGDGTPETRPVRMTVLSSLQQAASSGLLDITINTIQAPEQRQLVQANRAFADAYRFSLSGQQSSDAERLSMMLSITETAGDDPATIAQKARLREAMIRVTRQRAQGQISATDAATQVLSLASQSDFMTPEGLASFNEALEAAVEEDQGNVSPSTIPGDASFDDVDDLIELGIQGPGGR